MLLYKRQSTSLKRTFSADVLGGDAGIIRNNNNYTQFIIIICHIRDSSRHFASATIRSSRKYKYKMASFPAIEHNILYRILVLYTEINPLSVNGITFDSVFQKIMTTSIIIRNEHFVLKLIVLIVVYKPSTILTKKKTK